MPGAGMSQLRFLEREWPAVFDAAAKVEDAVHGDLRALGNYNMPHPLPA